jgi:hypothetical protein
MSHRNGKLSPLARWRARQCAVAAIKQRMAAQQASSGIAPELPAISANSASPRETAWVER